MMRAIAATILSVGPAASTTARQAARPPLSAYVGHAPFEPVDGVSFLKHPLVRAAVTRAVGDPLIRRWLLVANTSPSPPIFLKDGLIVSSGCQWHGCDRRNWAILIDPAGTRARVCYFDGSGTGSRWYAGDGRQARRDEDCPSQP